VARQIGVRLLRRLDSPFQVDGCSMALGVSIGIAFYPDHGRDLDSLLSSADQAMYQAKRTRSGCAVFEGRQHG
jgi:diguanylate cyclase (GGDEF)-like protein